MVRGMRIPLAALCALLVLLTLAASSGAAGRAGIGRMTVTRPASTRARAATSWLSRFWPTRRRSRGRRSSTSRAAGRRPSALNPNGNGYLELQPTGCTSATRITGIVGRRVSIAAACGRKHLYKLLYHRASAPLLAADGCIFLHADPSGEHEQECPVQAARAPEAAGRASARGAVSNLFMTVTSVATVGVPFAATVRAIDQWGNNAVDYTGTVTFTSTDPLATLPAPYAYVAADTAQHVFTGVILRTPGAQRITATDSSGRVIASGSIAVSPS